MSEEYRCPFCSARFDPDDLFKFIGHMDQAHIAQEDDE